VALLSAYVVSVTGTSMSAIAVPWLVLTATGSAAQTGVVVFAQLLPYVAAQLLAGPLVDRFGLRRSLVWGNAAAAVAIAAIPACDVLDVLTMPVLMGLAVVVGLCRGVADCANGPLVPTTAEVGGITLERAAGLSSGANRAALLLGAPLAGVLVTLFGSAAVVAINAGTFAIAVDRLARPAVRRVGWRIPHRGVGSAHGAVGVRGRLSRHHAGAVRLPGLA